MSVTKWIGCIWLLLGMAVGHAQEPIPGMRDWYAAVQVQCYLSPAKAAGTHHLTVSVAVGTALRPEERSVALWLQSAVNLYTKGLGTPVLDSYRAEKGREVRRRWQVDWVNSLLGAVEWGPRLRAVDRPYQQITTFNQMSAVALVPQYQHNLYYGTHFVWNNNQRHQQLGALGVHTPWVAFNYYNDGLLGRLVGDQYDRFWTGGGMLRLMAFRHGTEAEAWTQQTQLRYQYDRFTHDVQGGYRLSNLLLIPNADDPDFGKLLFNNAMTSLDVQWGPYSVGVTLLGRSRWDVQDAIHRMMGYPLHLTYAPAEVLVRLRGQPLGINRFEP